MTSLACPSHIFRAFSTPLDIPVLHELFAFQTTIGAVLAPGGVVLTQQATAT